MFKKSLIFLLSFVFLFLVITLPVSASDFSDTSSYLPNTTLKNYYDSNRKNVNNNVVWVGDDMAVWTNNAYTHYMNRLETGYDGYNQRLEYVVYDGEYDFDFIYEEGEVYSAYEYYFFTKEAINTQVHLLEAAREELILLENENIQSIRVTRTIHDTGAVILSLVALSPGAPALVVALPIIWGTYTVLDGFFGSGYQYDEVIAQLNAVIAALNTASDTMTEGNKVVILQLDYEIERTFCIPEEYDEYGELKRCKTYLAKNHYRTEYLNPNTYEIENPNYSHVYYTYSTNSDLNKIIPLTDVYNYQTVWDRKYPEPYTNTALSASIDSVKSFNSISATKEAPYDSLNAGLNPFLSDNNTYDWYKFVLEDKNDIRIDVKNYSGDFGKPVTIELYDQDFNFIAASSPNYSYYYASSSTTAELKYLNVTLDPNGGLETYYVKVKVSLDSGDTYYEPYKLELTIIAETYQKQWYNAQYSYVWEFVSSETGTSPYFSSGTTYYSGEYKYVYTTSVPEYKYDFTKSQYYDKFTMVIKRKDILLGCDACDADDVIATYNWYENEAPSTKASLPSDTVYISSALTTTFNFPSSTDGFTYGGKYLHYNESSVNKNEYYIATYTKYDDNITKSVGTYSTEWMSNTIPDGKVGDCYYDYYNQQVRYRSTMTIYVKSYSGLWVNTATIISIGVYDTLPTLPTNYKWVRIFS